MRSKGNVNIGAIATQFSGGGHKNAAGCSARGTLKDVQERFGPLLDQAQAKGTALVTP
jgi:phosphoesterase RecJ-like protein